MPPFSCLKGPARSSWSGKPSRRTYPPGAAEPSSMHPTRRKFLPRSASVEPVSWKRRICSINVCTQRWAQRNLPGGWDCRPGPLWSNEIERRPPRPSQGQNVREPVVRTRGERMTTQRFLSWRVWPRPRRTMASSRARPERTAAARHRTTWFQW